MLHGRRRQALVRLGFGVFAQGRRWSGLVSVAAVVALVLAGPVGAGSIRNAQVVGVPGLSDVPGTSWSGIVAITENTQNFTYSGTDHVTFHLDGTGATSCGAGCYLQSFTWEADLARVYGTFCGPETWFGAGSGSVAQGANTGMTLSFASPGSFYDGTWSAYFLPHQTYSANYSGFSGVECSEPYSHNTLVLTLDPSIGGGISAGWFPEAPSFDAPTMHGSHVNELNLGGAHTSDTYVWSLTRYPDLDHDGVPNFEDNCPTAYNPDQADSDHDGKGDACADADNDGVPDDHDNCKSTANPGQVDTDSDGKGDACDADIDGDGQPNETDPCPLDLLDGCVIGPPPPPPDDSCGGDGRQAHRGLLTPEYDARIELAFAPDEHLFRFSPTVAYCWDGSVSEIRSAFVLGDLDTGVFDALEIAGQLLGFTLEYNLGAEQVTIHVPNNSADIHGEFGIAFNITKLFDKLGLKSKVEGYVSKQLGKSLAKLIENKGYNTEFKNKIADFAAFTSEKIRREVVKVLDSFGNKVPGILKPLAKDLKTFVLKKVDAKLDSWRTQVNATLSAGAFAGWTADQIGEALVSSVIDELEEAVTLHFPLWDIDYQVAISPSGQITQTLDPSDYKWALLTIAEHD